MTRVAGIDCGTNSIRLLVADLDPATGAQVDLARLMEVVRLGEGVDRTGRLTPEAVARTLAATRRYAEQISGLGAERVRFVATSASRDAENAAVFVDGVRSILGVEPQVVAGDEEAALSFSGASRDLTGAAEPLLVVDIGGGSTELVLGEAGSPRQSVSIDVGCVRLTERHVRSDPATAAEVRAVREDVEAALDRAATSVDLHQAATLVGLAGTVTTVAAIWLGLDSYQPERIHHSRIPASGVSQVAADLLAMTAAQRAAIPVMHPGRVDVIAAGALLLDRLVARAGVAEVLVSEHDILDGIAWSLV